MLPLLSLVSVKKSQRSHGGATHRYALFCVTAVAYVLPLKVCSMVEAQFATLTSPTEIILLAVMLFCFFFLVSTFLTSSHLSAFASCQRRVQPFHVQRLATSRLEGWDSSSWCCSDIGNLRLFRSR